MCGVGRPRTPLFPLFLVKGLQKAGLMPRETPVDLYRTVFRGERLTRAEEKVDSREPPAVRMTSAMH